jgi:hypothetical protein
MRMVLKGAAIALALVGTTFATAVPSNAQSFGISSYDRGRDHATPTISFDFGNVAFGYRDGYWDNSHRWHKWRNSRDHRDYRHRYGDNYRNGYHHRYRGKGWRR